VSDVRGSVNRKCLPIYVQPDAPLHSLFSSENCSTCFGCYFHPSSEAHKLYLEHLLYVTPLLLCSKGVTNTRCYGYSCLRSWWWVLVPPEICRAVSRFK